MMGMVDAMCESIELVDSRWQEALKVPPLTKLADLQSHGALILGDWSRYIQRNWSNRLWKVKISTEPRIERCGTY